MESILVSELEPGMRLDESVHLDCGTLVLFRGYAVDEVLLDALAKLGVERLLLCCSEAEVEELLTSSGSVPMALDELSVGIPFVWGLYEPHGRKLLSAGRSLTSHRLEGLARSGVELVFEPPSDLPARLARAKRMLVRRRTPRPHMQMGSPLLAKRTPPRLTMPAGSSVAETMLARAAIASEAEAIIAELSLGFSLDVPRAARLARDVVELAFKRPFEGIAIALQGLASGALRDHVAACGVVVSACAHTLGFTEDECTELATAALLHDAAMAWVREDLLAERGPLSEAGLAAVIRHPLRSFAALADADGLPALPAMTALEIHERPDGSGYPMGLLSDDLLGEAKLLAVVDVFCALLAPRPHRKGLSPREAIDLCVRLAGEGVLDGQCVRALLSAVGLWPLGSVVRLSTGELARVVGIPEGQYERPVVSILREASGEVPVSKRYIDLSQAKDVSISGSADAPWEGDGGF